MTEPRTSNRTPRSARNSAPKLVRFKNKFKLIRSIDPLSFLYVHSFSTFLIYIPYKNNKIKTGNKNRAAKIVLLLHSYHVVLWALRSSWRLPNPPLMSVHFSFLVFGRFRYSEFSSCGFQLPPNSYQQAKTARESKPQKLISFSFLKDSNSLNSHRADSDSFFANMNGSDYTKSIDYLKSTSQKYIKMRNISDIDRSQTSTVEYYRPSKYHEYPALLVDSTRYLSSRPTLDSLKLISSYNYGKIKQQQYKRKNNFYFSQDTALYNKCANEAILKAFLIRLLFPP